jgi:uncharacterized protein involved in exopolysaccharide biosynthesis
VEYLTILWRKKLLIILVAAGMLKATFVVINGLPDFYESRVLILVFGLPSDEAQASGAQIAAVTQQLLSRASLEALVRRYHLNRAKESAEDAVQRLRKDIKLETKLRDYYPQVPESISITYRHPDPKIAQRVLADLITRFEETNEAIKKQVLSEASQLSSQIAELEGPLRQVGEQRAATTARATAALGREVTDPRATRLATVSAIETLTDKVYALEQQIAQQKRLIAEQEKLLRSAPPARDSAYGVLLVRKTELEALLKEYATQYTDKNPKVILARNQLAEINHQLAQLDAGSALSTGMAAAPGASELRTLQRDLTRLETDLGITQRELERRKQALSSLPEVEMRGAETAAEPGGGAPEVEAEYDRLMKRYYWLLDKQYLLQRAQSPSGGEVGPALFKIIDPPHLPQSPVAPNRMMLKLAALAVAVGTGLLLAAAREAPRLFLIEDDRDVAYFLGAPVLGLIPETLTPVERSRRWRQRWVRGLALVLLVAVLVPAIAMLLDRLQLFQLIVNR